MSMSECMKNITLNSKSVNYFKCDGDFAIVYKNGVVNLIPDTPCFINKTHKPRYEHNCEACLFIGYFEESDGYYCEESSSIIARKSDVPSEYVSLMYELLDRNTPTLFDVLHKIRKEIDSLGLRNR